MAEKCAVKKCLIDGPFTPFFTAHLSAIQFIESSCIARLDE